MNFNREWHLWDRYNCTVWGASWGSKFHAQMRENVADASAGRGEDALRWWSTAVASAVPKASLVIPGAVSVA